MIGRNDPCWCGSNKKWKKCHEPELPQELEEARLRDQYLRQYGIHLKTDTEIEGITKAAKLTSDILNATVEKAVPGATTRELDAFAHRLHEEAGATPAPLGYGSPPYPFSICTSLNEVICHGFPDDVPLKEGDILNIDVSANLGGYIGDCSRMVVIGGKTTPDRQKVVDVAYECLQRGVSVVKPGALICEIGDAISDYAEEQGCSVVYEFVAHGCGKKFHEAPQILHSRNTLAIPMAPGMTFTIEPMINLGLPDSILDSDNEWIARTVDGKPSAQFEYHLLVTPTGSQNLTSWG